MTKVIPTITYERAVFRFCLKQIICVVSVMNHHALHATSTIF